MLNIVKQLFLFLFAVFFLIKASFAQNMGDIFCLLPQKYTPSLTESGRDSLLTNGSYTIPGGDSLETMKVNISKKKDDYIKANYYFTTGQSGFSIIELRRFEKNNGGTLVVYGKYGGAKRSFDQHTLKTFLYSEGELILFDKTALPETIPKAEFFKPGIPDSFNTESYSLSTGYNLYPDEDHSIAYFIIPYTNRFDKWLESEKIHYYWNGHSFIQSP